MLYTMFKRAIYSLTNGPIALWISKTWFKMYYWLNKTINKNKWQQLNTIGLITIIIIISAATHQKALMYRFWPFVPHVSVGHSWQSDTPLTGTYTWTHKKHTQKNNCIRNSWLWRQIDRENAVKTNPLTRIPLTIQVPTRRVYTCFSFPTPAGPMDMCAVGTRIGLPLFNAEKKRLDGLLKAIHTFVGEWGQWGQWGAVGHTASFFCHSHKRQEEHPAWTLCAVQINNNLLNSVDQHGASGNWSGSYLQ